MPKKRGRPKKEPEDRKAQTIAFRVEADERAQIETAAAASDMKLSDWIRARLLASARREIKRADGQ